MKTTRQGAAIAARRQHLGWTVRELAARAGVSHATVTKIERGQRAGRLDTLTRLAAALHISVRRLV